MAKPKNSKSGGKIGSPSSVKAAAKKKAAPNLPATKKPVNLPQQHSPEKANVNSPAHHNLHPPNLDKSKLNIGLASILAQAEPVVEAFGKAWGFVLLMTAILASAGFSATTALVLAKGVGRLF